MRIRRALARAFQTSKLSSVEMPRLELRHRRTFSTVNDRESLIPYTLSEMEEDAELKQSMAALKSVGQKRLSLEERRMRRRALDSLGVPEFEPFLRSQGMLQQDAALSRDKVTMLQLNVGLYCNQACTHCHVESSPKRKEAMSDELVQQATLRPPRQARMKPKRVIFPTVVAVGA